MKILHVAETIRGGIATYFNELHAHQCDAFGTAGVHYVIPTNHRNDLLYKKSYVMGRQLIRGWISARTIEFALMHGARCCGLVLWTGEAQVQATIMSGLWDGIKVPYRDLKCLRCCVVEHPPLGVGGCNNETEALAVLLDRRKQQAAE